MDRSNVATLFVHDPFSQCRPDALAVGKFVRLCRKNTNYIPLDADGKAIEKRPIRDDEKAATFALPLDLGSRQRFSSEWTAVEACHVCDSENLPSSFELVVQWGDSAFFGTVSEVCPACFDHLVKEKAFANWEEIEAKFY